MRIALAQMNTVVGDLEGNRRRILERLDEARAAEADLVLFPELAVTGYPPEDLLLRPGFLRAAARCSRTSLPRRAGSRRSSGRPTSTATSSTRARSARTARSRRCTASSSSRTTASSTRTATSSRDASSCSFAAARRSSVRPSARTSGSRARPPPTSRSRARTSSRTCRPHRSTSARASSARRCSPHARATTRAGSRSSTRSARRTSSSSTVTASCSTRTGRSWRAPAFEEALLVVDVDPTTAIGRRLRDARRRALAARAGTSGPARRRPRRAPGRTARRRSPLSCRSSTSSRRCASRSSSACATTSRRTASRDVVLGISGGIDSALTAALAAEALGAEHVVCVSMPSEFSSDETKADAKRVAEQLGARYLEIPINRVMEAFSRARRVFSGTEPGIAEENVQARVRAACSSWRSRTSSAGCSLATGNKSELSVGLRDALRRHGRRLRTPQGRVQDRRVPAGAPPERARRPRADPRVGHRARAERGAAAGPARRGLAAAVRRARPRCSRPTSSSTRPARS